MGLDSYFRIKKPIEPTPDDPHEHAYDPLVDKRLAGIRLVGGMMSGNGPDGSFRGKCYADMLHEMTGHAFTLYEEEQGPDAYQQAEAAMRRWLFTHDGDYVEEDGNIVPRQEVIDLRQLFAVAAEHDAVLLGWW